MSPHESWAPPEWSRRDFVRAAAFGVASAATWSRALAHAPLLPPLLDPMAVLPAGPTPTPVALPHFPSRVHAFVWRNWSLVPVERMAAVVGATPAQIRGLGRALGLGRPPRITREQERRSYITVIKRNWHLLPYEQLLALLSWTPAELAYTLREDDFLWIKLGSLKPKCEPIRWQASDGTTRTREAAIARIVHDEFADEWKRPGEPLFQFVRDLSAPSSGSSPHLPNGDSLRFCYSYFALYGDPLMEPDLDPFPDGFLARLAANGVNGVWLQAVLYKLAPFPWQPELSAHHEARLHNLARLVDRARRRGVRVFLYLNEPRAMPLEFFKTHPGLQGVVEGDHATLCTSHPDVQRFLTDAVAGLCRAVPDLGGFFTISASENLTNCWSHGGGARCPRCGKRPPGEVIAEVHAVIQRGIADAGGRQQLIAWDWGWSDAWAPDAIARLPAEVALMSVSEWSLPIERGGVKGTVGEYCLSAVGPGPRATKHWALAKQRGLKVIAKMQVGVTWELAAVPYLPVLANVAEHVGNLRRLGLDGIMLGWTLGGYPSANLQCVAEIMNGGSLDDLARKRWGEALAPLWVEAWRAFSTAFREFPYDGGVVYSAPLQSGPSNLLWSEPTGFAPTMVGFPYDHLDGWRAHYPVEIFIAQMEKVADGFEWAIKVLRESAGKVQGVPNSERHRFEHETGVARAAAIHFRSVANQSRFVSRRNRLAATKGRDERRELLNELEAVLRDELRLAKELHAIQRHDSRIGFEASNHYFYVPMDLAEKVLNCRDLLDRWLPAERARVG